MQVIAIDWSGRATGAAEYIWAATVRDGRLCDLRNGRAPAELADWLVARSADDGPLVIGLDFAFSFPRWWCEHAGWATAQDAWRATAADGETWLADPPWPFWGRPGMPRDLPGERGLRRTEREVGGAAKSVFQIGGAGSVGTGSIRGMPMLLRIAAAGISVWPFAGAGDATALEVYPRVLTGDAAVRKRRWSSRRAHFAQARFSEQPQALLERAAGSEDAFDAAVSALSMSDHLDAILRLPAADDADYRIEGRIWTPDAGL